MLSPTVTGALERLRGLLGERLSTSAYDIETHSHDESCHPPAPPDAVAFPLTTAEVAAAARACYERGVAMIPFGAGTAVEGHVQAVRGGVSIDLSRLNRILEIHPDDLDCRVEAGVSRVQLNQRLEAHGLFFPIDPGAEATLGGMAATGASGTTAVRYGTMRENVLGLTVVLADGRVIRTGGRARKSSAGYDLTRLFVGSEGTLGIITEAQLKLQPLPEAVAAAVCPFETLDGAVRSVVEVLQAGIPVARSELMDAFSMKAVNSFAKLSYPEQATIFFEFHGTPGSVEEQAALAGEVAKEHGGGEFQWATRREDRDRLWEARHRYYYAAKALRPGKLAWPTDVAVPLSHLAECILETRREIDAAGLTAPILGHAGDGNFHVLFLIDSQNEADTRRAKQINESLIQRALEAGGTCTGEHGIGLGKQQALRAQHGEAVEVMRAIKQALDPRELMNPGKIFGESVT